VLIDCQLDESKYANKEFFHSVHLIRSSVYKLVLQLKLMQIAVAIILQKICPLDDDLYGSKTTVVEMVGFTEE